MSIREFEERDWPALWAMLEPIFRAGETYALPTDVSQGEAYRFWVTAPRLCYVAVNPDDEPIGSYFMKTNHPGPGSHVCNCGYAVSPEARGQGLAGTLCQHSLDVAREQGYRAMQYNMVVANNTAAIHVWRSHGFEVVGTIPEGFEHPTEGFVDAYVMHRHL